MKLISIFFLLSAQFFQVFGMTIKQKSRLKMVLINTQQNSFFDSILPPNPTSTQLKFFFTTMFERDQSIRRLIFECAGHKLNSKTPFKKELLDSCRRYYNYDMQKNDSINRILFDSYFQKYSWPKQKWSKNGESY